MDLRYFNTDPSQGDIRAEMLVRLSARGKLLVVYQNPYAFVFAEGGGGHGGEFDLTVLRRDAEYYKPLFDQCDVGLPSWQDQAGWQSDGTVGYAWRVGQTARTAATIRYLDERHEVAADANGYWAFIRETSVDGPNEIPMIA
jgi:hypothetical protein